MAGIHRPSERMGGRALPDPVLNVAPLRFRPNLDPLPLLAQCTQKRADYARIHPHRVTTEGDMDANTVAINFVWTLVAGFLVMFMQAGFALVETGFTRSKNAAHTMTMNLVIFALGVVGWFVCGYALMFGATSS